MRISLIQICLSWENPAANLAALAQKMALLAGQTDVVVLPEMFTTGFTMDASANADTMEGYTLEWMQAQSSAIQAAVTGSFICVENSQYYNRLLWVEPNGAVAQYDKRHLFTLAGEHEHYTAGTAPLTVHWKGFRIRLNICYDLRFPVWSRNKIGEHGYDVLIYVANWPAPRAHQWRSLLQARAIENQAYVAAVNIVGTDGKGHQYLGDSLVFDFSGQTLTHLAIEEGVSTVPISMEKLLNYRAQFPFLADSDVFKLEK